jgi:hypothetical protein
LNLRSNKYLSTLNRSDNLLTHNIQANSRLIDLGMSNDCFIYPSMIIYTCKIDVEASTLSKINEKMQGIRCISLHILSQQFYSWSIFAYSSISRIKKNPKVVSISTEINSERGRARQKTCNYFGTFVYDPD